MRSADLLRHDHGLPDHEAVRLLMAATNHSRSQVLLGFEVDPDDQFTYERFVARRQAGEPLQYIEGSVPFGPVELLVDDRVLIPRQETEYLFEKILGMVHDPKVIVDLCTGSGNLALALAASYPQADVYAVDVSENAAEVARTNAERNGLSITVLTGDLFEPLPVELRGAVDLLISNPPYLASREEADLPVDVLAEPAMALVAGPEGDEVLARIAADAEPWLAPGATIACEISEFHAERVAELFERYEPAIVRDLTGRDRYVFASTRFM